jgi:hypothetical protein
MSRCRLTDAPIETIVAAIEAVAAGLRSALVH